MREGTLVVNKRIVLTTVRGVVKSLGFNLSNIVNPNNTRSKKLLSKIEHRTP